MPLNQPNRSPMSTSSSSSSTLGASFLGYYFLGAEDAAGAATVAADTAETGPEAPRRPWPAAMSWWMVLPLSKLMTLLMSSSLVVEATLPSTAFISAAAK